VSIKEGWCENLRKTVLANDPGAPPGPYEDIGCTEFDGVAVGCPMRCDSCVHFEFEGQE